MFGNERIASVKTAQTFREAGFDVFPYGPLVQMAWLVAPAGLPDGVATKLRSTFGQALRSDAYKQYAEQNGFAIPSAEGESLRKAVEAVQATIEAVAPKYFKKT